MYLIQNLSSCTFFLEGKTFVISDTRVRRNLKPMRGHNAFDSDRDVLKTYSKSRKLFRFDDIIFFLRLHTIPLFIIVMYTRRRYSLNSLLRNTRFTLDCKFTNIVFVRGKSERRISDGCKIDFTEDFLFYSRWKYRTHFLYVFIGSDVSNKKNMLYFRKMPRERIFFYSIFP